MADIFLSYTREDSDLAFDVVQALEREGWSVWFDRFTPIASHWEDVLELELERARCIVMLWSAHALESKWVPREGEVGMERAALVPALIQASDIPDMFGSIQFANLTSWDGNPAASEFINFLQAVRDNMLPRCRIRFQSLLEPRLKDLKILYDTFLQVAGRIVKVTPGSFQPPSNSDEKRRLTRTIASLQVSIEWDSALSNWIDTNPDQKIKAERIERRMPLIWLSLLGYSGPFFSSATNPHTCSNFLRFASLMFYHHMFSSSRFEGRPVIVPSVLTSEQLSFPLWEGAVSTFFDYEDEIARAYVTHIDDSELSSEEVFYGPQRRTQLAYARTFSDIPYTDPLWFEQYMIPQNELRLALDGSTTFKRYAGNVRIRKITDLDGNDLPQIRD